MEDMMQEPEQVLEYVKNNEILNKQSKNVVRKYISLAISIFSWVPMPIVEVAHSPTPSKVRIAAFS